MLRQSKVGTLKRTLVRVGSLACVSGALGISCGGSSDPKGGGGSAAKAGAANTAGNSAAGSNALPGGGPAGGSDTAGSTGSAGAPSAGSTASGGANTAGGSANGGATNAGAANGGAKNGGATNGGATNGGGNSAGSGTGGGTHTGKWKIMPLGDSTTAATCVRARLWGRLTTAGKTNIDFVGTETGAGCTDSVPAGFDQDNEGHSCYIVSNLVNTGAKPSCTVDYASNSTDLAKWFDNQTPDIVLMHFGTNDIWNGYGPTMILPAYKAILDKLRTRNPNVKMFVAQIIPLKPDTGKDYDALARALNSAIPAWATMNSTSASPIVVVDQFTGYTVATDNVADGVHPNPTGSDKIAKKWFDAIQGLL